MAEQNKDGQPDNSDVVMPKSQMQSALEDLNEARLELFSELAKALRLKDACDCLEKVIRRFSA